MKDAEIYENSNNLEENDIEEKKANIIEFTVQKN